MTGQRIAALFAIVLVISTAIFGSIVSFHVGTMSSFMTNETHNAHSSTTQNSLVGGGDFSISVTPSSLRVRQGDSAIVTVTLTSLNGFVGTITLGGDISPAFLPTNPPVLSAGSTDILKILIPALPPSRDLVLLAVSGTQVHSAIISLLITQPVVCLAPADATSCPDQPPILTGPSVSTASQLRLAVVVDGSELFNGFDITLLSNASVLKPAGVDLVGTILTGTVNVVTDCIGGVFEAGARCAATDTPDTMHFAAVGGYALGSTHTGLLFTAIYNITGDSPSSQIGFQTGCSSTSVEGGVCVTLATGARLPAQETFRTASFSNLSSFSLSTDSATFFIPIEESDTSIVTTTSLNGFRGNLSLSAVSAPAGPVLNMSPASVSVSPASPFSLTNESMLTISIPSNVFPGNYTVEIVAGSENSSASIEININVPHPFFEIFTTPRYLNTDVNATGTFTVATVSVASFTGQVLSTITSTPSLTTSLSPNGVSLTPGGVIVSNLTARPSLGGFFQLNITGVSGSISDIATAHLFARDFRLEVLFPSNVMSLIFDEGTTHGFTVQVESPFGIFPPFLFVGNVTLTYSITPAQGLSLSCNPTKLYLGIIQGGLQPIDSSGCLVLGTVAGNYTINFRATTGTVSHSAMTQISIISQDFTVTGDNSILPLIAGHNATRKITIASLFGFQGNVTLSASTPAFGPAAYVASASIFVPMGGNATTTLTVTTSPTTALGYSTIYVNASSGLAHHAFEVQVNVTALPPDLIEAHWKHRVSLSKSNDAVSFTAGFFNPNNSTSLYISVQVNILGRTGGVAYSTQYPVSPLSIITNIPVSVDLPSDNAGNTFVVQIILRYQTVSSVPGLASLAETGYVRVVA